MHNRFIFAGIACLIGLGFSGPSVNAQESKKSPLVDFEIIDMIETKAIQNSLTGERGDPVRGEQAMINRKKGNCLACHRVGLFDKKSKSDPNKYGDMGDVGPELDGVATRYTEGQLRLLLVDVKQIFPETIMPSFYRVQNLNRVLSEFENKPILSAGDVEDILSFLMTLK